MLLNTGEALLCYDIYKIHCFKIIRKNKKLTTVKDSVAKWVLISNYISWHVLCCAKLFNYFIIVGMFIIMFSYIYIRYIYQSLSRELLFDVILIYNVERIHVNIYVNINFNIYVSRTRFINL